MKVSLRHIEQYLDITLPSLEELVEKINAQLGGVEKVIDLATQYKDATIVRVVSSVKHADADKLSVCMVDDGGVRKDIERDKDGLVQVVCGAPNVHADMWAIWLPPASTVPASYGTKEPFVLDARKIRGVVSKGMLAAADELGIGTDHSGIIELHDSDLTDSSTRALKAGQSFAAVFGLDDTIIDIENKMFTHRPDLFGQLGVAREVAGISHTAFASPAWYLTPPAAKSASKAMDLTVHNTASEAVPRYMAVVMKDITVQPSPMWLQCELIRMGGKPINNVVDVTNLIMLITAQPTHAYDYDTLESHTIGTRFARKGESVKLINGKTYELIESDIVIVDGARPIGLAGIMGGNDTEVTKNTTTIVLEVASFDMYALRRSSMRHGLFTDALTRFSKGQSPRQNPSVIQRLMHYIEEVAGGTQASEVFDMSKGLPAQPQLDVRTDFINDRLGLTLTTKQISTLLGNVEFAIKERQDNIEITVPFWRTDIVDPEDIVEEIGRLYGLDKLPRELPKRTATPTPRNRQRQLKRMLRESMKRLGANEVLTYSFVHEDVMKRAEQQIDQAFRLGNALSPDLQYYRLSVLPSLLDKVHMNIKAGHDEFVLYEIGKGHNKKYHASDDEGLPSEMAFVDAVYTSRNPHPGAAYYHVRKMLDQLSYDLGFGVIYKPIDAPLDFPVTAPFDLSRSALVETTEGIFVGMIGELKPSVLKGFKLPAYTAAMTLDTSGILSAYSTPSRAYRALSKYPSVSQDISLKVASAVTYQQLLDVVHTAILQRTKGSDFELTPQSIYQAKDDTSHKTISLRLRITNYEKTLTDADVTKLLDHAATVAKTELKAERI